jgi:hypothetical protein
MNELIGRKVTVYSVNGAGEGRDIGILESVDGPWLRIRKSDGEVLFFSAYQIRLVKPFDPM